MSRNRAQPASTVCAHPPTGAPDPTSRPAGCLAATPLTCRTAQRRSKVPHPRRGATRRPGARSQADHAANGPAGAPKGSPCHSTSPEIATHTQPGAEIQRVLRDLRPRARVLVFMSGKGGVGKTNLAVNMAIGLAAAGRRVLLVDADVGLANVDLVLGEKARGNLGHALAGRVALADIVQEGPAGIHWIPGASQMPSLSDIGEKRRARVLEELKDLETAYDFLLLDASAGLGPDVIDLARRADELVLVTTPEPTALVDGYATLKTIAASGAESIGQVRLIVNMVAHRRDAETVHGRLGEAAGRFFGVPVGLLGYVFCDGHVGRAVQRQQPLLLAYPHSQAAWCIKHLVSAILEGRSAMSEGPLGFLRRMANRIAAS